MSNITSTISANVTAHVTNVRRDAAEIHEIHSPSIVIIDQYLTPLWYVLGFPGNLMAFAIWIQKCMRPSSGCYLAALALTDFMFLVLHLFHELQSVWHITIIHLPILCETFPIFFLAAQYLSPLLVLGFTVERYISICHPFKRERFCTTRRATITILILSAFSLSLHFIQGYFWTYSRTQKDCNVRREVTVNDTASLWSVWSWITELLVFGIVPISILILNIIVIKEIHKLTRSDVQLRANAPASPSSSATTVMLLTVSFYLIVTTLPVTICYALNLHYIEGDTSMTDEEIAGDETWQRNFAYWNVRIIVQELGMSHYVGNFYIYLLTGKVFRREFLRTVYRCLAFFRPSKNTLELSKKSGTAANHDNKRHSSQRQLFLSDRSTCNGSICSKNFDNAAAKHANAL